MVIFNSFLYVYQAGQPLNQAPFSAMGTEQETRYVFVGILHHKRYTSLTYHGQGCAQGKSTHVSIYYIIGTYSKLNYIDILYIYTYIQLWLYLIYRRHVSDVLYIYPGIFLVSGWWLGSEPTTRGIQRREWQQNSRQNHHFYRWYKPFPTGWFMALFYP